MGGAPLRTELAHRCGVARGLSLDRRDGLSREAYPLVYGVKICRWYDWILAAVRELGLNGYLDDSKALNYRDRSENSNRTVLLVMGISLARYETPSH